MRTSFRTNKKPPASRGDGGLRRAPYVGARLHEKEESETGHEPMVTGRGGLVKYEGVAHPTGSTPRERNCTANRSALAAASSALAAASSALTAAASALAATSW